ncbi:MAG: hypothetical protein JWQ60_4907 [Pseudonocardia sp.]|nr:hypothetical protein [Pseudonocardia sp.]
MGTLGRRGTRDQPLPAWRVAPGYSDPPPAVPAQAPSRAQLFLPRPGPQAEPDTGPSGISPGADPATSPELRRPAASTPALLTHPVISAQAAARPSSPTTELVPLHAGVRLPAADGAQLWIPQPAATNPRPPAAAPATERLPEESPQPEEVPRPDRMTGAAPPAPPTQPSPAWQIERPLSAWEPIGEAEAAAFAARFAADYMSWDEDDPTRRAEVLREYLGDPRDATLGWSGTGRQRADVVLPGRTMRTRDDRLVVEVTVRVTTYERACPSPAPAETPAEGRERPRGNEPLPANAVGHSSAPAPYSPRWCVVSTHWARLAPPISRDQTGRLVVDIPPAPNPERG